MAPSYGATIETDAQIFTDIADINGAGIAFVAYGVHATLYFLCLTLLWEERKKRPRATWIWISYITLLFIMGSIGNGANMYLNQDAFVNNRNYPGGPGQFEIEQYDLTYNAVCTVVYIVGTWFTDGLLIFRFYTILGATWWLMVVPCAVYLVSIIMSIFLLHQLVSPGGTLWVPTSVNFALAYWSTSVAINIMLTIGIVGFLLYMRFKVRRAMGSHHHSASYLSISAMLIESAFLYTAFALCFLIPLAMNNNVNLIFFQVLPQIQFIAPLLIILRVAQGRALTRKAVEETIRTATGSESGGLRFDPGTTYASATISLPQQTYSAQRKSAGRPLAPSVQFEDQREGQALEMLAFRSKDEVSSVHDAI